jgi:hypothetical protein
MTWIIILLFFKIIKFRFLLLKKIELIYLSVLWGALNLTWIEFNIYSYWYSKCERETYRQQLFRPLTILYNSDDIRKLIPLGIFLKVPFELSLFKLASF